MEQRDFKGVWIPKEIWLSKELSALDKCIFAEIDSLDNEDHCTAGNDYLAEFCQCSERKVSETISKLIRLGYIEMVSFDGRCRVLKVADSATPHRKNCESGSQNLQPNNTDIKITDNKVIPINRNNSSDDESDFESHSYSAKELRDDFLGSAKRREKVKRKSLYDKCVDEIYQYTKNAALQAALLKYLPIRLAIKDKPIYGVNQWVGLLNRLSQIEGDKVAIVIQSLEKGWCSFYAFNSKPSVFSEGDGVYCESATDTAEERQDKLTKQGRRAKF